jgi:NCAIR mutase (PurE)-related protein
MNQDQLQTLLTQVQRGVIKVPEALQRLRTLPYENLGFASLDHHRALRQGFPEVIFCEGKTERQVVAIAKTLLRNNNALLATRVERSVAGRCCGSASGRSIMRRRGSWRLRRRSWYGADPC